VFKNSMIWERRLKAAMWLLPVLLLGAVAHWYVLPMAQKINTLEKEIIEGEQNVYETSWLDSVQAGLTDQINDIKKFLNEIDPRIVDFTSLQAVTDKVRRIFSGSGLTVLRIRPSVFNHDGLRQITIRVDGITSYSALIKLFKKLSTKYPQYSIERMTVRKIRRGLNFSIFISAYDFATKA